ncbi:hypothetical protein AOQ84DRAFT_390725 [Glonium stellatum]|uniref:BTB domain-containing protein n=1 Tax=Glonium stellatum TaxID=574774 RepID=A0A8E2EVK9_9PEZI|nr:hypothetical protein AOQ84DRAFT_390725 [Glonium stellatum]
MPGLTIEDGLDRHRTVTCTTVADLIIRVNENVHNTEENRKLQYTTDFKVFSERLTSHSTFFMTELSHRHPKQAPPTFVLEGDNSSIAIELWFIILHREDVSKLPEHLLVMPLKEVWNVVGVGAKFNICYQSLDVLRPWFAKWYERNCRNATLTRELTQQLAFPCFVFNHAEGFMKVTKWLAYNCSGHIIEKNPTEHRGLHLEPRVFVGPTNAARGHLKTVLHRELWGVCLRLHRQKCVCRKETYFDYQDKLMEVRAWPLEQVFQHNSMNDIISRLSLFSYTPTTTTCTAPFPGCHQGFDNIVNEACERTIRDFDGLCLDCMDRSKLKHNDDGEDYWRHNYPANGCWDSGCRFGHGRSTWYHSWMGRLDKRREILERLRNERYENSGIRKIASARAEAKEQGPRQTKQAQEATTDAVKQKFWMPPPKDKAEHDDDDAKDDQDKSDSVDESPKPSDEASSCAEL